MAMGNTRFPLDGCYFPNSYGFYHWKNKGNESLPCSLKSFFWLRISVRRNGRLSVHSSAPAALCDSFPLNQQDRERMTGFFPLKPSAPTAQFWLNNVMMALRGKHLKEKVGTKPPWKEGWLIVSKRVFRKEQEFCFLKAGQGSQPAVPICYWAENTAASLHRTYCHPSSVTGCFFSLTGHGEHRQEGCFQLLCSES